jgi:hypothetical protein
LGRRSNASLALEQLENECGKKNPAGIKRIDELQGIPEKND